MCRGFFIDCLQEDIVSNRPRPRKYIKSINMESQVFRYGSWVVQELLTLNVTDKSFHIRILIDIRFTPRDLIFPLVLPCNDLTYSRRFNWFVSYPPPSKEYKYRVKQIYLESSIESNSSSVKRTLLCTGVDTFTSVI